MKSKFGSMAALIFAAGILGACNAEQDNNTDYKEEEKANKTNVEIKKEEDIKETKSSVEIEENLEDVSNNNLSIGDSYSKDGLIITLNEVRKEKGGEFDEAKNGEFLVFNVSVLNNTNAEFNISSLLNFELKDSDGYPYSPTLLLEGTKSSVDGEVSPGDTLRGEIAYDAPDSKLYEFHYSEVFAKGKGKWKIDSSEVQKQGYSDSAKENPQPDSKKEEVQKTE